MNRSTEQLFTKEVVALMLLGIVGRSIELTLPVVTRGAQVEFAMSEATAGFFAAVSVLGVVAASLASPLWARRLPNRPTLIFGLIAFVGGNLASTQVGAEAVLALRFITALLGEGTILVAVSRTLANQPRANRIYAVYMAAQMLMGALLLTVQGLAAQSHGFLGVMAVLAAFASTAALTVGFVRKEARGGRSAVPALAETRGLAPWLCLTGMGVYHLGIGGAWAFLLVEGVRHGLDFERGGGAMALVMGSGLLGTVVSAYGVRQSGSLGALIAGGTLLIAGGVLCGSASSLVPFLFGGGMLMVGWNLSVPHQVGLLGRLSQNHPAMIPGAQGVGLAVGPVLLGGFASVESSAGMATIAALAGALSTALFWIGYRRTMR